MPKTKEELQELKEKYINLKEELQSLDENELKEVVGSGPNISIKPKEGDNFWHSYNPCPIVDEGLQNLDLLNKNNEK